MIAGRSACTDSDSTESAIATCGMPKFRKPRRNLIDLKNRRKVDFKVDYSSLMDPFNEFIYYELVLWIVHANSYSYFKDMNHKMNS
jgi:hypothetical protein